MDPTTPACALCTILQDCIVTVYHYRPTFRHLVLLHRVAALGRALLVVGGLALTALGTAAQVLHAHTPGTQSLSRLEQPTIEAHGELPTDRLKTGEQVEIVSVEMRSVVRAPGASASALAKRTPTDYLRADRLRWCDVVQCRRLGGAMLLGFATPPPAHR